MLTGPTHCYQPSAKAKKQTKQRDCLRCGEPFKSAGPHNRRCPTCTAWMGSEECPYSDGNFLYALIGEDADTILSRRKMNSSNAKSLHTKKAPHVRPG